MSTLVVVLMTIALWFPISSDMNKKIAIKRGALSLIVIVFYLLGVGYCGKYWFWPEKLLFGALLNIAFMIIGFSIINRTMNYLVVLRGVFFVSISFAIYSIVTYGQTDLHSDTATATLLCKSQLENYSMFPKTWNYANGDIWVLTSNVFVMPFMLILKNQVLARVLGSVLLVTATILAVLFLYMQYEKYAYYIAIPIFLLYLIGDYDYTLYQAAYTSAMLWMALCPLLLYRGVIKGWNVRYFIAHAIIIMALCMMGIRNFAEIVLPMWVATVLPIYFEIRTDWNIDWKKILKKFLKYSIVIWIPAIIGYCMYIILCQSHNVNNSVNNAIDFATSIDGVFDNSIGLLKTIFCIFGYQGGAKAFSLYGIRNFASIAVCIIVMFVVPLLQTKIIKKENQFVQFYYIFAMSHNLIMIIMVIFFGKTEQRYFLSSVFACILLSSRYIMKYWISKQEFRRLILIGTFSVSTLIMCISISKWSKNWSDKVEIKRQLSYEIENLGYSKGYATYWNAYTNEVYSDLNITYGAINVSDDGIYAFKWLVDSDVYNDSKDKSFLLLTQEESQGYDENVRKILGDPRECVNLQNYVVYLYNYDIGVKIIK